MDAIFDGYYRTVHEKSSLILPQMAVNRVRAVQTYYLEMAILAI
jgi:hypothetical protein